MCASAYCCSPSCGCERSWRQSKIRQSSRRCASCSVDTSVVRLIGSYFGLNCLFYLPDARLVALVENPLLDARAPDQPRLGQDLQMLADSGLTDAELLGDEDRAHAVLDQIAVHLRRKMAARILQPFQNLQAALVGERA